MHHSPKDLVAASPKYPQQFYSSFPLFHLDSSTPVLSHLSINLNSANNSMLDNLVLLPLPPLYGYTLSDIKFLCNNVFSALALTLE